MGHARIGRVRMKGGATVVPLRKDTRVDSTPRRDQFLQQTAQSYDSYVSTHGYEPDAMVTVYCGLKQCGEAYWAVRGASEGGGTSILAFAQAILQAEIARR